MRRPCVLLTTLVLLGLALVPGKLAHAQAAPATARLVVDIVGFDRDDGVAIVSLFDRDHGWPRAAHALRAVRRPVQGGKLRVVFEDLPPGRYAVGVIQDLDGNGTLTLKWWPYPHLVEQAGTSNNPKALFGPPSFADAVFSLGAEGAAITIQMTR